MDRLSPARAATRTLEQHRDARDLILALTDMVGRDRVASLDQSAEDPASETAGTRQ